MKSRAFDYHYHYKKRAFTFFLVVICNDLTISESFNFLLKILNDDNTIYIVIFPLILGILKQKGILTKK